MKECRKCQVNKPLSDFNRRRQALDGRESRCRSCRQAYYADNRERHIKHVRLRNDEHRKLLWKNIAEYLLEHPCVGCGETDLRALEFDHRDASLKSMAIGRMIANCLSWSRLLSEIQKCDVRCCNCHRIRTGEQFGSWRIAAELARAAGLEVAAQEEHDVAVARLARILPQRAA